VGPIARRCVLGEATLHIPISEAQAAGLARVRVSVRVVVRVMVRVRVSVLGEATLRIPISEAQAPEPKATPDTNPDTNPYPNPNPDPGPNPSPNPNPNRKQVAQYELTEDQLVRHGRYLHKPYP
jgi:hypothetical protein